MVWLGEFALYVVIVLVITSLIRAFLIAPFIVPTGSMEHTIMEQDTILAWRPGAPQRGEIVVFEDKLDWLGPTPQVSFWKKILPFFGLAAPEDAQYLVKRLIGLPGDHVACCDARGRVTVNGTPLDESSYLYFTNEAAANVPFDYIVPQGRFFVMGDHRDGSKDSRFHICNGSQPTPELAFPELSTIQGKVVAIVSPTSRWRTFHIPATFADIPPPTGTPPAPTVAQWTCP